MPAGRPKNEVRLEGIKLGLEAGMTYQSLATIYKVSEGRISQIVAYAGLPARNKRWAKHGKLHRYRMGCRCEPCTAAYQEYYADWVFRRRSFKERNQPKQ